MKNLVVSQGLPSLFFFVITFCDTIILFGKIISNLKLNVLRSQWMIFVTFVTSGHLHENWVQMHFNYCSEISNHVKNVV